MLLLYLKCWSQVLTVACGTRTFTNTAGRQCPWTSCLLVSLEISRDLPFWRPWSPPPPSRIPGSATLITFRWEIGLETQALPWHPKVIGSVSSLRESRRNRCIQWQLLIAALLYAWNLHLNQFCQLSTRHNSKTTELLSYKLTIHQIQHVFFAKR